ncbi:hypothetical protein SLEP1_g4321 [Rubroshorea leprosula]|uniref:VQ domain-containing protein n=1 Tax=Rubroshorea leprosula TaxID=152421 RepID=A0AAV5HX74_9ROSI|nr:hypothetical protein SLEP1_g4321 [Rubroshorea leprosula]
MSPAKSKATINGHRPSPLKISKDSHFIHKSTSSSSIVLPQEARMVQEQKQRQPVIIYVYSPKIIHTQPRDFMALVQKLTGLNSKYDDSDDENKTTPSQKRNIKADGSLLEEQGNIKSVKENDSSPGTTDENCGRIDGNHSSVNVGDVIVGSSLVSPIMNMANPFFADMPLFTPNSMMNFFCSPRSIDRFEDSAYVSSNNA